MIKKISLILVAFTFLQADPFGPDSDLAYPKIKECHCVAPSPLAKVGVAMIQFYQDHITQIDRYRSHYRPSSAQYTKEAMLHYGFFCGVAMGCDRLMRENKDPWVYPTIEECEVEFKFDPVFKPCLQMPVNLKQS